jgi:amino acid permease
MGFVFPVAVYSQIFHHSVPGLSHPLNDKRKSPRIFSGVLATTMGLYAALGISVAAYYGAAVPQTCTLAWADYTGSSRGPHEEGGRPGWAWFISYLVVLFPPLDIISAFPLNAITLGNNLLCAFVPDERKQALKRYKIPFRLLAAMPPVVGALVVRDLGVILKYTGCVGVLIAFVYPCVLTYQSERECKRRGIVVGLDTQPLVPTSSSVRRGSDPSSPLSVTASATRTAVGLPSYSPAWVSDHRVGAAVLVFSVVGLVAVIILSILGLSN